MNTFLYSKFKAYHSFPKKFRFLRSKDVFYFFTRCSKKILFSKIQIKLLHSNRRNIQKKSSFFIRFVYRISGEFLASNVTRTFVNQMMILSCSLMQWQGSGQRFSISRWNHCFWDASWYACIIVVCLKQDLQQHVSLCWYDEVHALPKSHRGTNAQAHTHALCISVVHRLLNQWNANGSQISFDCCCNRLTFWNVSISYRLRWMKR